MLEIKQRRTKLFSLRLSQKEKDELLDLCEKRGVRSPSLLVREWILEACDKGNNSLSHNNNSELQQTMERLNVSVINLASVLENKLKETL